MLAETLLAGPRGRRLLLDYAQSCAEQVHAGDELSPFGTAVFYTSFRLAKESGQSVFWLVFGTDDSPAEATPPEYSLADVVAELDQVGLCEPTADLLFKALRDSVESAMYWQAPDGSDLIAADPGVRKSLRRFADKVAASPLVEAWSAPFDADDQRAQRSSQFPNRFSQVDLQAWRAQAQAAERRAVIENPTDINASFSGFWWSCPPADLLSSTPTGPQALPLGMWLVEDSIGLTQMLVRKVESSPEARVFEISSGADWATLCRRYPLEVTAQKRHAWYQFTGRDGRWLMPDWCALSDDYDGVHLTIAAYLEAATRELRVDDEFSTVMAGCDPSTTWWLTDAARPVGEEIELLLPVED